MGGGVREPAPPTRAIGDKAPVALRNFGGASGPPSGADPETPDPDGSSFGVGAIPSPIPAPLGAGRGGATPSRGSPGRRGGPAVPVTPGLPLT